MTDRKLLLCLDVDATVHGYQSGWLGADRLPDPPVPGAMDAIRRYQDMFRVALYSARTGQPGGLHAMRAWLHTHLVAAFGRDEGDRVFLAVEWPLSKPPAHVTLDDRAVTFTGTWPALEALASFVPWNRRDPADEAAVVQALSDAIDDQ